MPLADSQAEILADRILAASGAGTSIPPITDESPDFDVRDAYRVAAQVIERRRARGESPLGWKIGFTNRTIWDEYGVHAPIWGPMYSTTFQFVDTGDSAVPVNLRGLIEPRLEPEIALRLAHIPRPDMEPHELIGCVDAVAHGFEVVQSLYPGWRFRAADTIAAFALHGIYRCGPLVPVDTTERETWLAALESFEVALSRNEVEVDRGVAGNVLGGPLHALGHLVRGLADHELPVGLKPGDLVTTGTVTRAFPVAPGEVWSTEVHGLPVPGLALAFQ